MYLIHFYNGVRDCRTDVSMSRSNEQQTCEENRQRLHNTQQRAQNRQGAETNLHRTETTWPMPMYTEPMRSTHRWEESIETKLPTQECRESTNSGNR